MPQMAPLWWFILFCYFTSTLILFNVINYFLMNPTPPALLKKCYSNPPLNWKW